MEPIPYVPTAQLRSAAQPVMTVEDVTQGVPSPYARPARNDDPLAVARGD